MLPYARAEEMQKFGIWFTANATALVLFERTVDEKRVRTNNTILLLAIVSR